MAFASGGFLAVTVEAAESLQRGDDLLHEDPEVFGRESEAVDDVALPHAGSLNAIGCLKLPVIVDLNDDLHRKHDTATR